MEKETASVTDSKTYLNLSYDSQRKVDIIYWIARIFKEAKYPDITPKYFDTLYDMELEDLMRMPGILQMHLRESAPNPNPQY